MTRQINPKTTSGNLPEIKQVTTQDVRNFLDKIENNFSKAAEEVYGDRVYEKNCYGYHKALKIILGRKFPTIKFEMREGENTDQDPQINGTDQRWIKATMPDKTEYMIEGTKTEFPIKMLPYSQGFKELDIMGGIEFDPDYDQKIKYDQSRIQAVVKRFNALERI